jgi:predicted glycogen debranching enzyme
MPIRIAADTCRDFLRSSKLEWLETNGTGAFAMGTVAGANTRRYHAHLIASLQPPVERRALLAKTDERVLTGGGPVELGANQFPFTVFPRGFEHLEEFRLDPFPVWRYRLGELVIEKSLFLVPGRQLCVVQYRANQPCSLESRLYIADRDYHSVRRAGDPPRGFSLASNAKRLRDTREWYYNFEYLRELERGLEFREDLFSPRVYTFELAPEQPGYLVGGAERNLRVDLFDVRRWEADRLARGHDPANDFLVRRADAKPTVIAGYPWFTDWGRDTMISLPGLLLSRGRVDEARAVIQGYLEHLNQGLIPNRFPDSGQTPEYNTVDATLWLFEAVRRLPDPGEFRAALRKIIDWHIAGTLHQIHVDPEDGLLSAGSENTQLTWMDARVGDWVVTPRHGKAVEINALWINALAAFPEHADLKEKAAASFRRKFWNANRACLYDCLTPHGPDGAIRPNQLFALSLSEEIVEPWQAASILRVVEAELLTDVGLRTLSPRDPHYQHRYNGPPLERDGAYHQGTVWPWLMGPYLSAVLKVRGRTPEVLAECRRRLDRLWEETGRYCLGHLPEIHDGDAPHGPVGAPAQAWSLAEYLRIRAEVGD